MAEIVDWASLLTLYDGQSIFSTSDGQNLLIEVLGESNIESAVDHYVNSVGTSSEALRYALRLLQPAAATKRCLDLLWRDGNENERMLAGDLLGVTSLPADLDSIEALLINDDPVRQTAALYVLFKLQWSIDLDTDQMCRITRHCVDSQKPAHRRLGLGLAIGALDEILDRNPGDGGDRLTTDEIEVMFARTLASGDPSLVEAGLECFPDFLVDSLEQQLTALAASNEGQNRTLAQELLDNQIADTTR